MYSEFVNIHKVVAAQGYDPVHLEIVMVEV